MLKGFRRAALLGLALAAPFEAWAQAVPEDPLKSVMWSLVRDTVLETDAVVFDERVRVFAPATVEDGMNVPVSVSAEGIAGIQRIVVVADHNPIHKVLEFEPLRARPFLAFRIKVQEATPVRAAVLDGAGVWRVGGLWVDAPGGGCTTPSATQVSREWETHLNQVQAQVWRLPDGGDRLRLRLIHPMDTGLVDNIPAFYLHEMELHHPEGGLLARLKTFEPVSENPVFTFSLLPGEGISGAGYLLQGVDSDGNRFSVRLPDGDRRFDPKPFVQVSERRQ